LLRRNPADKRKVIEAAIALATEFPEVLPEKCRGRLSGTWLAEECAVDERYARNVMKEVLADDGDDLEIRTSPNFQMNDHSSKRDAIQSAA